MIYLDHNATTPVAEEVLQAMLPYFRQQYGNASSRTHLYGWEAREAVETARKQLAALLEVEKRELVFTSGATEAINLALRSTAIWAVRKQQGLFPSALPRILTVKTEHKAVLDTCAWLERYAGVEVEYLEVDAEGKLDLQHLAKAITPNTFLLSVMYANNETGLIHPMAAIAEICKERDVLLFCDATQALGKMEVHPRQLGIDMLAGSAHKMYGPKGVGALYIRKGVETVPQLTGGGQERKRRAGTLNVPGIVGFGEAAARALDKWQKAWSGVAVLRDRLEQKLMTALENVHLNGCPHQRLPQVTNLRFDGIVSEDLMLALSTKVAVSAGSACNSAEVLPSHVLKAMGLTDEEALSSLRFSLGLETTEEQIDQAVNLVVQAVNRLRS